MTLSRRLQGGPQSRQRGQSGWFSLLLFLLVVLYWLFAHRLERIDLSVGLNQWWQTQAAGLPLPQAVIFAAEMLHPRVLRHLIPVAVGWWLAYGAAVSLVQSLYDLPDRRAAGRFLSRLQSSRTPLDKPVPAREQTLTADREKSVLLRVGGPGRVFIVSGEVGVTELNGRFCRVLPPGVHKLGRLEHIHAVLDLRQQERVAQDVPLVTRDGIEIRADIGVTYRIDTGGEPATRANPYPFDEDAVRTAAYAETNRADGKISTWEDIPLGAAKGQLTKIIAKYRLDELLYPHGPARDPFLTVRNELKRQVRQPLDNAGIELTGIRIEQIELPQPVTDQYIQYWQTHLETQLLLSQADGKAATLEEVEIAKAEAEVTMIQAIVEGVQRARRDGSTSTLHDLVALRLVEALEKMARQSQQTHTLPANLLSQLGNFRQQLRPGTDAPDQPGTVD